MAATEQFDVDEEGAGVRLDRLLAALPSVGSREKARTALRAGKVLVDGARATPEDGGRRFPAGSRVEIEWNRPGSSARRVAGRDAMERAGVTVVFSDDAVIICDKPVGLLTDSASVQQAKSEDTLRKRMRAWVGGGDVWPVHRIDRNTTGLVCFARSAELRMELSRQWEARTPLRCYLALVQGRMEQDRGTFSDWMNWDKAKLLQRSARPDTKGAVLAQASWEVRERFGSRATLLEVRLSSGRRNQIRLQAQLAGHPLVGETLYRDPHPAPTIRHPRYALHALRLGFNHPQTGEPVLFEAPPPDDLVGLFASLRDPGSEPTRR